MLEDQFNRTPKLIRLPLLYFVFFAIVTPSSKSSSRLLVYSVRSLPVGNPHLHIALHGEEVSLHGEWVCLIYQLKFEFLDHLGDKLVQLNLRMLAC